MERAKILFFDDFPFASENRLFVARLRRELKGQIDITEEKTVRGFEESMSRALFSCVILDVMAESPKEFKVAGGGLVPPSLTGVELLRRVRNGSYEKQNSEIPVFMRTARGETQIRSLCTTAGATGYFRAGIDDTELIEKIKEVLGNEPFQSGSQTV